MKKAFTLLLLMGCISMFSCSKEDDPKRTSAIAENKTTSGAIREAQSWFEAKYGQVATAPTSIAKSSSSIKKPLWEKASVTVRQGKEIVWVPLQYEQGGGAGRGERRRLMIFEDDKKQKQAQVMRLVGESFYLKQNKQVFKNTDYTGLALVSD